MAGGFPSIGELCNNQDIGAVIGQVKGTPVSCGTTGNTKYNWVELVASLANDCCAIGVGLEVVSQSNYNKSVDIGVGIAGQEKIVIADIYFSHNEPDGEYYFYPVSIPAGSRIAARAQANGTAGDSITCKLDCWDSAFAGREGFAGADCLGFTASTTLGTTLNSGSSANTKPASFTQLIAATARDYAGILPMFGSNGTISSSYVFAGLCDIAIGAAGSEQIIVPNYPCSRASGGQIHGPSSYSWIPVPIPAGVRVSARYQSPTTNSSNRTIQLALGALYK